MPDEKTTELTIPEKKELAPLPEEHQGNIVMVAMQQGYDANMIEKMMDLQERLEKSEAKKAYIKAMAAFKENPPKILKDTKVEFETSKGTTGYSHAKLAAITNAVCSELSKHGLSADWETDQKEKISVTCIITHILGHSESTTLSAGPDTTGNKNAIQAIGSTVTYLQRYTLLAKLGLATHDMDDDGQNSEDKITEAQIIQLNEVLESKGYDVSAGTGLKNLAKSLNYKKISDLPESKFEIALNMVNSQPEKTDA